MAALDERNKSLAEKTGDLTLRSLFLWMAFSGYPFLPLSGVSDRRIAQALSRMTENPESTPSIAQLAGQAGLSQTRFREIFERVVGKNPKSYLDEIRFRRAAEELWKTDFRVKEIARHFGFQDDHYFHSRFKQVYGLTPSQYRKRGGI
ncbi:MAG: helix-turn-helix transcriptional regulator [Spirochaetia bacterium]|nr:helix-turn-helix transcriptional regulator [Spirochaetia bacterium]